MRPRPWLLVFLAACSTRGLTDGDTAPRDAVPPTLDVRAPARGTVAPGAMSVEVRGFVADADSGGARVVVNGLPAQVGADGSFVATVAAEGGLVLLHTEVFDVAGNSASDSRAVLAGAVAPIASTVPHAFYAHLDGASLALVGAVASEVLTGLDVGAIAAALNPLVDLPIPCFSVRVDATAVKKGKVTASVVADRDGLTVDAEVDDLEVDLHVAYELACDAGAADVRMTAGAFHLATILGLAIGDGGAVTVTASQTTSRVDGLMLEGGLPAAVDDAIEGPLGTALAGLVAVLIEDEVPSLLGGLLGGEQRVEVAGQTLTFALTPTALQIDASGLDVALDSRASLATESGIVFPVSAADPPRLDASRPFRAALADDAMNQVLAALWGAGLMDQSFSIDAGSYAGLGTLFDTVEVALRLPPVVTALPGNQGLEIAVGDVECRFLKDGRAVTRVSVSARTAIAARLSGGKLSLTAGEPTVWLDVLTDGVSGANPLDRESVQSLGSYVAKALVGVLLEDAAKLPIPSVDGIAIAGADVTTGVGSGGYVLVGADLTR